MKLNLHPIQNDHATLASLAQFYLYELSEIENLDICDNGRFEHDILHGTAVRSDLLPFVIYAAEQLIGFVLISQHSRMRSHFSGHSIETIFVLRRYRRHGLGRSSVCEVFDRFPGVWEVATHGQNVRGMAFWRSVIDIYTNGSYQETWLQEASWRGTVHSFLSQSGHYE